MEEGGEDYMDTTKVRALIVTPYSYYWLLKEENIQKVNYYPVHYRETCTSLASTSCHLCLTDATPKEETIEQEIQMIINITELKHHQDKKSW